MVTIVTDSVTSQCGRVRPGKVRLILAFCLALVLTFWSTCAGLVATLNTYGS